MGLGVWELISSWLAKANFTKLQRNNKAFSFNLSNKKESIDYIAWSNYLQTYLLRVHHRQLKSNQTLCVCHSTQWLCSRGSNRNLSWVNGSPNGLDASYPDGNTLQIPKQWCQQRQNTHPPRLLLRKRKHRRDTGKQNGAEGPRSLILIRQAWLTWNTLSLPQRNEVTWEEGEWGRGWRGGGRRDECGERWDEWTLGVSPQSQITPWREAMDCVSRRKLIWRFGTSGESCGGEWQLWVFTNQPCW